MKFSIKYTGKAEDKIITYVPEDYAFDIDPVVQEIDFNIALNMVNLKVLQQNGANKIIEVWVFCPYGGWLRTSYHFPASLPGELCVLEDLECGLSYGINDEEWPVYVNKKSGWVCIGNPQSTGEAVEFINNCVAVIDSNQELTALWLKPQELPEL